MFTGLAPPGSRVRPHQRTAGREYPMVVRSWRANWTNLSTFFDYPPEMRKVIYTTNAIESINAQRWKRPIKDWAKALDHMAVVFEGRVPL